MAASSQDDAVDVTALADYFGDLAPKWATLGIKLGQADCVRELIRLKDMTQEDKCVAVLQSWVDSGTDVSWTNLCSLLRSKGVELEEVAKQVQQAHVPQAKQARPTSISGTTTTIASGEASHDAGLSKYAASPDSPYLKLHRRLKRLKENDDKDMWDTEEERNDKTRKVVGEFFDVCQRRGLKHKEVASQIEDLYEKEHYIPSEVYSWTTERLKELEKTQKSCSTPINEVAKPLLPDVPTPRKDPLFSQENMYHALLCCKALESSDEQKVVAVFRESGHLFERLSVTKNECQKKHGGECSHGSYLIAQKGDTFVVAFRGLPDIDEWKKLGKFQDAIAKLASFVPSNYFAQLVKDNGRVVFTGYSLGGTLACAVLTNMLKSNPLQQQLLEENVACITFGQPPLVGTVLENLMTQQKFLSKCFHYIHLDDCVKPILLKYCLTDLSSPKTKSEGSLSVATVPSDLLGDAVKDLLIAISGASSRKTLQKKVQQVKEKVGLMNEKGIVKEGEPPLPKGNYYRIWKCQATVEGSVEEMPVKWEVLQRERVLTLLSQLDPSRVTPSSIGLHHVAAYYELLPVFLEMVPGSTFVSPDVRKTAVPDIEGISPELESIDLHCYEREVVILVSGKNLWFARDLQVNEIKALRLFPCAQENAERQIQVWSDRKRVGRLLQEQQSRQKVSVGSCLEVPKKAQTLTVTVKHIGISARQAQLAKLSHSDLLSTALLSAVLERRSKSTCDEGAKAAYSRKYEKIRSFLNLALDVVPMEGFFHCLAASAEEMFQHHSELTAVVAATFLQTLFETVDTFCSRSVDIPSSDIMFNCLNEFLYGNMPMSIFFAMCQLGDAKDVMRVQQFLQKERKRIKNHMQKSRCFPVLSEENIRKILHASPWEDPVKFLDDANKDLHDMASSEGTDVKSGDAPDIGTTEKLLALMRRLTHFSYCLGKILDSFMSAQVQVPFSHGQLPEDTARALESTGVAVGVWYLIGLSFVDMKRIVQYKKLVIDVASYLGKFLGQEESAMKGYTNKIGFICQAMTNRVSCSAQYVGYSLERQLNELCSECGISLSTSVERICQKWDEFFGERILSLIPKPYHPLIARWIRWTLAIYQLRETLASYTTIATIGLLNSGKSTLVNSLFGQKVPSGTMESKRTTVPFLYSLEPDVDGIDVIDFPGVDDCNPQIQGLCEILFHVAHIVIFLVDYRKAHSDAAMGWLSMILQTEMPVLICLTFGDKLFAEIMPAAHQHPKDEEASAKIQKELKSFKDKCSQFLPNAEEQLEKRIGEDLDIMFCAFSLDKDSTLHEKEGRRRLRNAEIKSAKDVGDWIIDLLRSQKQPKAADSLQKFFDEHASGTFL